MEWKYLVEEVSGSKETIEAQLADLDPEWEAVTSWTVPGDPHINQGAWRTYILFKKPR
jgi:hypothetical protein